MLHFVGCSNVYLKIIVKYENDHHIRDLLTRDLDFPNYFNNWLQILTCPLSALSQCHLLASNVLINSVWFFKTLIIFQVIEIKMPMFLTNRRPSYIFNNSSPHSTDFYPMKFDVVTFLWPLRSLLPGISRCFPQNMGVQLWYPLWLLR